MIKKKEVFKDKDNIFTLDLQYLEQEKGEEYIFNLLKEMFSTDDIKLFLVKNFIDRLDATLREKIIKKIKEDLKK